MVSNKNNLHNWVQTIAVITTLIAIALAADRRVTVLEERYSFLKVVVLELKADVKTLLLRERK